jgi:hypothetical protein
MPPITGAAVIQELFEVTIEPLGCRLRPGYVGTHVTRRCDCNAWLTAPMFLSNCRGSRNMLKSSSRKSVALFFDSSSGRLSFPDQRVNNFFSVQEALPCVNQRWVVYARALK